MSWLDEQAQDFLAQKRIAVAGVTRKGQDAANLIYNKLKSSGHEVFAVNPRATEVEGDPCFPDLKSIPGGVMVVSSLTWPSLNATLPAQCPCGPQV